MKKLLVVDGNSILNRAYYGVRMLTTVDGLCTNAVYGMINILQKQLDAVCPDYAAIAFDLKAPTFRHAMYEGYKASRKGMPPELAMQLPYAKRCAEIMGFRELELAGYEADDILGTLAALADSHEDLEVYVLTGDRDSLQLIDERIRVLLATNNDTVTFDTAAFREKYGISPAYFVQVKALMGDSSDDIPGVAGIGEKTALKLIAQYQTLENLYRELPTSTLSAGVRGKLESGRESAYLSRNLAQICRTVPLEVTLEDLAYGGMDRKAAKALFLELEFSAFIKKYKLEGEVADDLPAEQTTFDESLIRTVGMDELLSHSFSEPVAIHYADGNLDVFDGEVLYRTPADKEAVIRVLSSVRYICYDSKALYKQMLSLPLAAFDVTLGAYVLDPAQSSFSLDRLTVSFLGESPEATVPAAVYLYRLYGVLSARLAETAQERVMYDIELPLAAVLARMEEEGFTIDREALIRYGEQLTLLEKEFESRIYFYAGEPFNIQSPKQLGEVLFEKLKLPSAKKTKTGYSTNAEVLEKLRSRHPIVEDILEYRQVSKLKSTYVDGLLKLADPLNDKIHTTFKQTGTATGRLSSAEPNLQNIPIRTELGREMRKFFVPKNEEYLLLDADYSQIELRLLAAISGDENMIDAFRSGEDIHTATASAVFDVPADEVTLELRKRAKAVNFGIVYGIGEYSLSQDIGTSVAQAKEYITSYLERYPAIDAYLKNVIAGAYEKGYVTTVFGRRRYIPELAGQNKILKHFGERVAMNSPIQGTAADIIKIAMIHVDDRLRTEGLDARLILQVHDELIVEAHRDCADRALTILREEMERAATLAVPLLVEVGTGSSWFDCK